MARTNKVGIDYFSFDVDFFSDDKVQLIEAEFGIKGSIIAIRLLTKIYSEGYYYSWGEDQCLLLAKNAGQEFNSKVVHDIVDGLVRRSFFDENCYKKYQILTSTGIQRRYLDATVRYKEVKMIKEYLLIEESSRDNVIINSINADINSLNADSNPQRKGKEIEKENRPPKMDVFPFENFWNLYDKKVGKEKCFKKWNVIPETEKLKIKNHLRAYIAATPDKQYRKDPKTYLNNKSWDDEIVGKGEKEVKHKAFEEVRL